MQDYESWVVIGSLLLAAVLFSSCSALRETTLFAPRNWAIFALLVCCVAAFLLSGNSAEARASDQMLRYLAGICTFAPFMALLGAKRPQNKAWQFVVLTLLFVLAGPAISAFVNTSLLRFRLPGLVSWLLWALIAFEVINFAATRMWLAVLGIAAAQIMTLHTFLPGTASLANYESAGLVTAAIIGGVLPAVQLVFICRASAIRPERSFAQLWSDFRTLFGTTWSLRVMMMFNNGAEKNNWPVRLGWGGIESMEPAASGQEADQSDAQITPAMDKSLRMLLRRFVSTEWMEQRWSQSGVSAISDDHGEPGA